LDFLLFSNNTVTDYDFTTAFDAEPLLFDPCLASMSGLLDVNTIPAPLAGFNIDTDNGSLGIEPQIRTLSPDSSAASTNDKERSSSSTSPITSSSSVLPSPKLSKKRPAKASPRAEKISSSRASPDEAEDVVCKRQRNTAAARRYRKRKEDRQSELETLLAEMTKDRDDLRLRLARSEAEADVLRSMVKKG